MQVIATESGRVPAFFDPDTTADGNPRAKVALTGLHTLWFNTGTLCNLACEHCYIESSPSNDRLAWITRAEVAAYLDEIRREQLPVRDIGFTGGEPFMNPQFMDMLEDCLEAGFQVLVLTNAMRPMMKCADRLAPLASRWPDTLTLRVSVDHYSRELHERERGRRAWQPTVDGLRWLAQHRFRLQIAGRTLWGEDEGALRAGFAALLAELGVPLDASDPAQLVLFPEMDDTSDVPEITTACWSILGVDPATMMCASARMVVRYRDAEAPTVVACTLLPYAQGFGFGPRLADSLGPVALNHPHCARFCVLGGGSCGA